MGDTSLDTGDVVVTLLVMSLIFLIPLGSCWCWYITEGRRPENNDDRQRPEETRAPSRRPPAAKAAERASTAVARLDHVSYLRPQQGAAAPPAPPEDSDCTICLGPFEDAQWCSVMPGCRHEFHKWCITGWFEAGNSTCPLCRAQLQWPEVAQDMV